MISELENELMLDESWDIDIHKEIATIDPKQPKRKNKCKPIFDFILNLIVVTPLAIFYWASSWDLTETFIFPNNIILKFATTFLLSNFILFILYLGQDKLQSIHDRIRSISNNGSQKKNFRFSCDFLIRCIYSYVLSVAYVLQWVTFWDLYDKITAHIHYYYFVVISLATLIVYRFILKRHLIAFVKTVPFYMEPDRNLSTFFQQDRVYHSKNVQY